MARFYERHFDTVYDDYDGTLVSKVNPDDVFHIITWTDMNYNCGRDNIGHVRYTVELKAVHLKEIPVTELLSMSNSMDIDLRKASKPELAVGCASYGLHARLHTLDSGDAKANKDIYTYPEMDRKLLNAAAKESLRLREDAKAYEAKLTTTANSYGTTAREYMTGNVFAGLNRQVTDAVDVRPADWMPYFVGYMDGVEGRPKFEGDDASPEYYDGYDRGVLVGKGLLPPPHWIERQGNTATIRR